MYHELLKKIQDLAKRWKFQTVNQMITYVKNEKEVQQQENPDWSIINVKDKKPLFNFFIH
ncbi:hypothetical protein FQN51_000895 [Onygenales sp. PD_10]|nr:hypothetical protein FQN51_000895 [Onygenales sp. PD_10]